MAGQSDAAWNRPGRPYPVPILFELVDIVCAGQGEPARPGCRTLPGSSEPLDGGDRGIQSRLSARCNVVGYAQAAIGFSASAAGPAAGERADYRCAGIPSQPAERAFIVCNADHGQPVACNEPQLARGRRVVCVAVSYTHLRAHETDS